MPAKKEPSAAVASAGPARPCLGHLVAVDRRDHARTFARQVDQDRGGRAAVLGAVVDAGEHDQGRDRRQAEGDRQQHGDGGDRAKAGQHADRRAEQHADEAVEQVERAERRGEAEPEIAEQFHGGSPPTGMGLAVAAVDAGALGAGDQ